jgi:hypothetical protein
MIRYRSEKQLSLAGFEGVFETTLDKDNRWIRLRCVIPWDDLAQVYCQNLSANHGRPAKDVCLIIGAAIIKHQLCLSDEETVQQIRENPYLQYLVGLPGFQPQALFSPTLFIEIRRRMGEAVFEHFHRKRKKPPPIRGS